MKHDLDIVRIQAFRLSAESIWRVAIEDLEEMGKYRLTHINWSILFKVFTDSVDKASLQLAVAHLDNPYLQPKINGITHISVGGFKNNFDHFFGWNFLLEV